MDTGKWFYTCLIIALCAVCVAVSISFDVAYGGNVERAAGRAVHHQMWGPDITPKIAGLAMITDHQIGVSFEELYGRIFTDSVLDNRMRSICTVSCLAAQRLFPEAEIHIAAALHLGWKPNEIREALLQLIYVSGFPVAIEAIKVLNGVLDRLRVSREPLSLEKIWGLASYEEKQGNKRETMEDGGEAHTIERLVPGKGFDEINWAAKGNHMGTLIYGKELWQELKLKAEGLSPKGPDTLVESIFGQIMARPGIDAETRSMCLITCLLAHRDMQGVKHAISGAFASGSDQKKIRELIYQMTMYVGWPTCLDALSVLDELRTNKRSGQ